MSPAGSLVYSTRTLLAEENGAVIAAFLSEASDFRVAQRDVLPECIQPLLDAEGVMRCLPHVHGTDGFIAVRLERAP